MRERRERGERVKVREKVRKIEREREREERVKVREKVRERERERRESQSERES